MKKQLFIVALLAFVLTGCKDTAKVSNTQTETFDLTVLHKDWSFDDKARQFYCHFDLPEITTQLYNYGNWTVSREYNKGDKNAYQVALPMSCFMTDTLSNGSVAYYTQYIDYRLGVGYIEVQLTNSDYLYVYQGGKPVAPEDMDFRLQLMY